MPNKTIYVSDDDLPLFQRAQELAGDNLSSALAQAVRRFVDLEEARHQGYEEVTLRVGKAGSRRKKRFLGIRLARWRHATGAKKRVEVLDVYQTVKGRFVVHGRAIPNWSYWSDPETWRDPANWNADWDWDEPGEYTFQVFESLDELRERIPTELHTIVIEAMQAPPLEKLDI